MSCLLFHRAHPTVVLVKRGPGNEKTVLDDMGIVFERRHSISSTVMCASDRRCIVESLACTTAFLYSLSGTHRSAKSVAR